jgi:hypothetical protein
MFVIGKETSPQGMREIVIQWLRRELDDAEARRYASTLRRDKDYYERLAVKYKQQIEFWQEVKFQ